MSHAKKLIDRAKSSGADAVKFQTFKAERLTKKNTPKVAYQKRSGSKKETHFEMLKKLELKEKDHILLKNYCHKKKIDFISTAYDVDSAMFLNKLGVKIFKTASADIVDHQMHKFLSKTGKHVIISTGMATIDEINQVIKIYKNKKNFSLLHFLFAPYHRNFDYQILVSVHSNLILYTLMIFLLARLIDQNFHFHF